MSDVNCLIVPVFLFLTSFWLHVALFIIINYLWTTDQAFCVCLLLKIRPLWLVWTTQWKHIWRRSFIVSMNRRNIVDDSKLFSFLLLLSEPWDSQFSKASLWPSEPISCVWYDHMRWEPSLESLCALSGSLLYSSGTNNDWLDELPDLFFMISNLLNNEVLPIMKCLISKSISTFGVYSVLTVQVGV